MPEDTMTIQPPRRRRRHHRRVVAAVGMTLAVVATAAACAQGDSGTTTGTSDPSSVASDTSATTPESTSPGSTGTTASTAPTTTVYVAPPLPDPSPALPSPGDNRVFILGDSVVLGAKAEIPAGLKGWEVTLDAHESRFITQGLGVLKAKVDGTNQKATDDFEAAVQAAKDQGQPPPDGPPKPRSITDVLGPVVVVSLCTNYEKTGAFSGQIDRYMGYLSQTPRVVWVTCAEWSPGQVEANEAIRAAATKYPNIVVADWAVQSPTPGYTYQDKIHLAGPGRQAIVDLLARALGPAPKPITTTTRAGR